jgi:hypothetical protein
MSCSRGLHLKRGWHPQPIHGQPDVVLSKASSQKLVFFASFYRILVKRSLNVKKVTLIILVLLVLITGFPKEPGNKRPQLEIALNMNLR